MRRLHFLWILIVAGIFAIAAIEAAFALKVNDEEVGVKPLAVVSIPATAPDPIPSLSDGLHFLDNATPSSFRDVINGQWLAGAATSLYKRYYMSLDAAFATPIGESGFYAPALRVYVGQILVEQVPVIRTLAQNNIVLTSLLNYITLGGWVSRDFVKGINRAGYNLGILLTFGK